MESVALDHFPCECKLSHDDPVISQVYMHIYDFSLTLDFMGSCRLCLRHLVIEKEFTVLVTSQLHLMKH